MGSFSGGSECGGGVKAAPPSNAPIDPLTTFAHRFHPHVAALASSGNSGGQRCSIVLISLDSDEGDARRVIDELSAACPYPLALPSSILPQAQYTGPCVGADVTCLWGGPEGFHNELATVFDVTSLPCVVGTAPLRTERGAAPAEGDHGGDHGLPPAPTEVAPWSDRLPQVVSVRYPLLSSSFSPLPSVAASFAGAHGDSTAETASVCADVASGVALVPCGPNWRTALQSLGPSFEQHLRSLSEGILSADASIALRFVARSAHRTDFTASHGVGMALHGSVFLEPMVVAAGKAAKGISRGLGALLPSLLWANEAASAKALGFSPEGLRVLLPAGPLRPFLAEARQPKKCIVGSSQVAEEPALGADSSPAANADGPSMRLRCVTCHKQCGHDARKASSSAPSVGSCRCTCTPFVYQCLHCDPSLHSSLRPFLVAAAASEAGTADGDGAVSEGVSEALRQQLGVAVCAHCAESGAHDPSHALVRVHNTMAMTHSLCADGSYSSLAAGEAAGDDSSSCSVGDACTATGQRGGHVGVGAEGLAMGIAEAARRLRYSMASPCDSSASAAPPQMLWGCANVRTLPSAAARRGPAVVWPDGCHATVACSSCLGPIMGTRWKCAQCFDYDLCDDCHANDDACGERRLGSRHHNSDHVMLRLQWQEEQGVGDAFLLPDASVVPLAAVLAMSADESL